MIVFRGIDRRCRSLVDSLIPRIFRNVLHKPSREYLTQISNEFLELHENSLSQPFLNAFLYKRDENKIFSANCFNEEDRNFNLQKLISNYYHCRQFEIDSFDPVDMYEKYLKSLDVEFQPTVLRCKLSKNFLQLNEQDSEKQKAKSLPTKNLEKFELTLPGEMIKRGLKEILFGQKFVHLSELKLNFDFHQPVRWCEDFVLSEKDVIDLEKLTPNLHHLNFRGCGISGSFLKRLLTSTLVAQLKSLCFEDCAFKDFEYLAQFLREAQMPNLSKFHLPYFIMENSEDLKKLNKAIKQLKLNKHLNNLQFIIFSNEMLDVTTVIRLLKSIARSDCLNNLEEIQKLNSNRELSEFTKIVFSRIFIKSPHSKFNPECIFHLLS